MTDPLAEQDDSSTPLSAEEREGLIPSYIALRGELNEAEQANILEADAWAFSRKRNALDRRFLNTLHHRLHRHAQPGPPPSQRRKYCVYADRTSVSSPARSSMRGEGLYRRATQRETAETEIGGESARR